MNKLNKILWGLVLLSLGVIFALNALDITSIDIFFKGWWTLFIIVPCTIGMFQKDNRLTNFIFLVIGVALLLAARDILSFSLIRKMIIPFVLIVVGITLIFNEGLKNVVTKKMKNVSKKDLETIIAPFASQDLNYDNEDFKGADVQAIFGSVCLDLRNANLKEETVIKATAIFGGIDILVPKDVNVKVKSTPIFGGVENVLKNKKENKKTIYIDSFCLFGGVDIK